MGTLYGRRERRDRTHHRDGPDRVDLRHAAGVERVLERVGDEAVAPVAAVVRADDDVAVAAQLLLEDDPLARPAADDARDLHALRGEALGDRVDHRGPHAAAHADRVAVVDELGGPAERAGDVRDRVADLERDEVAGALADRLDDERDRPRLRVAVRDRQRDPLGAGAHVDDDELAGLADLGDPGRLDDEAGDVGRELFLLADRVHRILAVVRSDLRMVPPSRIQDVSTVVHTRVCRKSRAPLLARTGVHARRARRPPARGRRRWRRFV